MKKSENFPTKTAESSQKINSKILMKKFPAKKPHSNIVTQETSSIAQLNKKWPKVCNSRHCNSFESCLTRDTIKSSVHAKTDRIQLAEYWPNQLTENCAKTHWVVDLFKSCYLPSSLLYTILENLVFEFPPGLVCLKDCQGPRTSWEERSLHCKLCQEASASCKL